MDQWREPDEDTTYKSQGVHRNRDQSAKMNVEAMDREGVTDSQAAEKQAQREAAAAATAEIQPSARPTDKMGVDEAVLVRGNKDVTQETVRAGHKPQHKFTESVDAGGYKIPTPGMGSQDSFGNELNASGGEGGGGVSMNMDMEGIMGDSGGEGGGMMGGDMMSGGQAAGASQLGQDIAAIDDEIDRANEKQFLDDTDVEAHQQLGERLQGR